MLPLEPAASGRLAPARSGSAESIGACTDERVRSSAVACDRLPRCCPEDTQSSVSVERSSVLSPGAAGGGSRRRERGANAGDAGRGETG